MSYCRFSTDDFKSDVYVYHSRHGYELHVASNRTIFLEPLPPPCVVGDVISKEDVAALLRRCMKVMEIPTRHEPIGLPHDGEDFTFDTPGECADMLEDLAELGYYVPDGVIEELREEEK